MISAVIIVFAFVTTAFTHPLTTQGQTTTGIEQTVGDYVQNTVQSAESVIPNTPQVEKTEYQGIQNVYNQQQQQQQQQPQPTFETVEQKTGVQGSSETYLHGVNTPVDNVGFQSGQEIYTQEKTSGADPVRPVPTYVEQVIAEVEKRPESSVTPVTTHVEKTETHGTPTQYSSEQQPVLLPVNPDAFPKQVEPVNVVVPAEPQQIVPVPVTPGVQPLSVLPVPGSQIVNPIVVPTEGVTGRLIIMSIEPIQQRVFQPETQNTVGTIEKQVPQQVNQPVDYTPVQGQVEPSNQQYLSAQNYVPENVEKQVPQQQQQVQAVNEAFTTAQQQVAEQTQQQLYNFQPNPQVNVAPVANNVEKQIPYHQESQPSNYVPNQPQEVEPNQQQPLNVQQIVPQQPQIKTEQQLPYQQNQVENTGYTPNAPYPAQKTQPAQQGVATHVPDHVPQNEHPKQSLPNQPVQSVQALQTFSCVPAQTLSAVPPNPQVPYVKPVYSNPN